MDRRQAPDPAAAAAAAAGPAAATGPAVAFRVEFRPTAPGEPVAGSVAVDGRAGATAFCGWTELLAVLTEVRGGARPPTGR